MRRNEKKIGQYRILKSLATGGMAQIYLAETPQTKGLNKRVTIKKILPQHSDKPDFDKMFEREAEISLNLQHSNIINTIDYGEDKGQHYLVMEYMKGKNLRELIEKSKKKKSPLPISHIVYIIQEAAQGLDYAHRCTDQKTGRKLNIIHRDISPQNVMISFEGEVKILDFGIAKAESKIEATRSGTLKGKFAYMSPEQVNGDKLDLRTDVFSLGIILWEMLTHRRLFKGSNEMESLKKIAKAFIPRVQKYDPSIPSVLDEICQKALRKDRTQRYQSTADFQKDLNHFLSKTYDKYRFSKQDFIEFIRELYAEEILQEQKDQQQYYQNHQAHQKDHQGHQNHQGHQSHQGHQDHQNYQEKQEGTEIGTKIKNHQKAPPLLHKAPPPQPPSLKPLGSSHISNGATPHPYSPSGLHSSTQLSSNARIRGTRSSSYYSTILKKENKQWLFIFFILLTVGTTSYFLTQNKGSLNALKAFKESITPKKSPYGKGKDPYPNQRRFNSTTPTAERGIATPKKYIVHINSAPQGAEIFINDKVTGLFTPSRIPPVKGKSQIRILLRKENYLPYSQLLYITKNQSFLANMKKANLGYIDVKVTNGGRNLIIFINKQRVHSPVPILRYAIPAGERVPIRVLNPITDVQANAIVQVKKNERKTVYLILQKRP